ncbi:Fic family protein [bacterium]|nr:Fic family protein [bacterium]
MPFSRNAPFNALPSLPPDSSFWETIPVYKKLAAAGAALAELKGRLPVIPNPKMLVNTLVLQEARDSSEIENVFTSTDKLYRAFTSGRKNIDPATKEVLRYREALWEAFLHLKKAVKWDKNLIVNIFRKITQKDETIRKGQVYIGNAYNIIYTPPEPGSVLDKKLKNWFDYTNVKNDIDPLIQMAIMHYQFEAIHPFSDGNGRSGRILNVLYLTSHSLLDLPILYISKYILEYKNEYYRLFTEVTEKGNWETWILYMLEAVLQTSHFTLGKVNAIFELFEKVRRMVREKANDIYSREFIEVIFAQPYCKIQNLVEQKIASRNTASKYLNRLADLGILEIEKEGKETLFRNKELYQILSQS